MTHCNQLSFPFANVGKRKMVAKFDGGHISSFGGLGLLTMTEQITGICKQLSTCFTDHRNPDLIEHSLPTLIKQRIFALAGGYEDINDHDLLRRDPLLAAAIGCKDILGEHRRKKSDRGIPLAGKSTINRMELTPKGANKHSKYKKISVNRAAMKKLLVDICVQAHEKVPKKVILDVDATDVTIHGNQQGKHYHAHYGNHCYLPLYIYCGQHVLAARLRPSNIDASRGALAEIKRVVKQLREHWGDTQIIIRGDSGFCRDDLMSWCESEDNVNFIIGMAKNSRLKEAISKQLNEAYEQCQETGKAARRYAIFKYKTKKSWKHERTMLAKAEHLPANGRDKSNPRFVATDLPAEDALDAQRLYENGYCPRGDCEIRIKDCQLDLFGSRLSTTPFRSNQLRLWLSAVAHELVRALIRIAAKGTSWSNMRPQTIREKMLKIGTRVNVTTRNIWLHLSIAFPDQSMFAKFYDNLIACACRFQT